MGVYRYGPLAVGSEWPLRALPGAGAEEPALSVRRASAQSQGRWRELGRGTEGVWLARGRQRAFRWSSGPQVILDGDRIDVVPGPACREPTGDLILRQVLPRVVGDRWPLVLHASGVEIEGRAVLFVGPSGGGKSTLAAGAVTGGGRLIADDAVLVHEDGGVFRAFASSQEMRLYPEMATAVGFQEPTAPRGDGAGKWRLSLPAARLCRSAPLGLVCLLADVGGSRQPMASCFELLAHACFTLDPVATAAARFGLICQLLESGLVVATANLDWRGAADWARSQLARRAENLAGGQPR